MTRPKSGVRIAIAGLAVAAAIILGIALLRGLPKSIEETPHDIPIVPATSPSDSSPELKTPAPSREADVSPPSAPRGTDIESRFSDIVDRLATAVNVRSVWKAEIKLLITLEDLLLDPAHSSRVKELLIAKMCEAETGRDLSGLLTFVLTVSPTDAGRKELAGILGRNKANDASLVYAITLRQSRVGLDLQGREAFWKGCMNFMERGELLGLGFRARLFKEEYGRTLEQIARSEAVRPSRADVFDRKTTRAFHTLQKKGFTTYIEDNDGSRGALVSYLAKGESPEAKRAICRVLKPGADLSHAAREAFMSSQSYSVYVRRGLLNAAQKGSAGGTWDTLNFLYPYASDMKYEMLEKMASSAKGTGPLQERTLTLVKSELAQGRVPESMLHQILDRVAEFRSDASENYLLGISRNHSDESVRSTAVSALYSDGLAGPTNGALIQNRVACAVEGFLKDPSTEVKITAANVLSFFLSEEGHSFKIANAEEVRLHTQAFLGQELIDRDVGEAILEGLEKYR